MLTTSRLQRTIASDTEVRGIGFFHNRDVALRLRPARANTGVVFVRTDLADHPSVRAHIDNVFPRPRRTAIRRGDAVVEMVEHVMAALAGMAIDNCLIEIDGPEPPGCDGSSLAYAEAIAEVGTVELDQPREVFVIRRPIAVQEGLATLTAWPSDEPGLVLSYQLDYGADTAIGAQELTTAISPDSFLSELAACRTFLTEGEAVALRAAGIGQRASESDLLIFGDHGVIGNTLRFPDECVRHKILDMLGDFALAGVAIQGRISAIRSGHSLNATLLRAMLAADLDRSAA
jgi:UDP-3-O-acyl N-acetylglucosamine deacetylase